MPKTPNCISTVEIEWKNRCKKTLRWGTLEVQSWLSMCGVYKLECSHHMPTNVWRAMVRDEHGEWRIIRNHRARGPAEKSCEEHAREQPKCA